MSNRSTLLLEHHLKELRLPTFLREYRKLAAQCAAEREMMVEELQEVCARHWACRGRCQDRRRSAIPSWRARTGQPPGWSNWTGRRWSSA